MKAKGYGPVRDVGYRRGWLQCQIPRKREAPFPIAHEAFHALVDVTKSLLRPMNLAAVLDQILTQVEKLFGYEICSVILPTGRDDRLYIAAHRGYDPAVANTVRIKIGEEGIVGHVAATGKPYYAPDVSVDPYYIEATSSVRSEFTVPLIIDGRTIGVLDVESSEPDDFPEDVQHVLEAFAALAALAIYRAQHQEELEQLALTDGLTGLANNRAFWEALHRELARARRFNQPLSLLVLEIDKFKEVNDTYGHLKGDEALRGLAHILGVTCRSMDIAARFGGDEFALILPQTTKSDALTVAERLMERVEDVPAGRSPAADAEHGPSRLSRRRHHAQRTVFRGRLHDVPHQRAGRRRPRLRSPRVPPGQSTPDVAAAAECEKPGSP